ncbi:hypothetical protein [Promicromonospora sp. NPDC023987]|uniref:hypothetical protein n=1 Tax=Promicromonospora sp. NPDC023987 TaxID=3155360 RepID=UPI0033FC649D
MQELVGRLTALDPEASETLKVVAYFDVLVAGGVGLAALLRGAAVLSGAVAGAVDGRRTYRIGPDGDRLTDGPATDGPATGRAEGAGHAELQPRWPTSTISNGRVWLERHGSPHANDAMVVERLALAVDLVAARHPGRADSSLETALDATRDTAERRVALSRLRLDPAREVRVVVRPVSHPASRPVSHLVSHPVSAAPSTVVATSYGLLRAVVLGHDEQLSGPAGVGLRRRADELPESFRTAVLALRLLPADDAVVDATDLGVVLTAVSVLEPVAAQQPDVVALARLDRRTRAVLDELAGSESVRAAAAALGMHHSTLQVRHDALTSELGYDPRSLDGRARYRVARLLLRLVEEA